MGGTQNGWHPEKALVDIDEAFRESDGLQQLEDKRQSQGKQVLPELINTEKPYHANISAAVRLTTMTATPTIAPKD